MHPRVRYYEFQKLNKRVVRGPKKENACFAMLARNDDCPYLTQYDAVIDKSLSKADVLAWIEWLKELLDYKLFKYKVDYPKQVVTFYVKSASMPRSRLLLYLTAMRYLDEFPDIVKHTIVLKGDIENRFDQFLEIHEKSYRDSGWNLGGHGLTYTTQKKVSFKVFKENVTQKKLGSVVGHFSSLFR